MKIVRGDLIALALAGEFDVIMHGCNCQCRMSRGVALAIKEQLPEAWDADRATEPGDRAKLGNYSYARIIRGTVAFIVINAYTQWHWGGEGVLVDYLAVRQVCKQLKVAYPGGRVGYPKIGAGLARGDWEVIAKIINTELAGMDHTLVEFIAAQ